MVALFAMLFLNGAAINKVEVNGQGCTFSYKNFLEQPVFRPHLEEQDDETEHARAVADCGATRDLRTFNIYHKATYEQSMEGTLAVTLPAPLPALDDAAVKLVCISSVVGPGIQIPLTSSAAVCVWCTTPDRLAR